MHDEFVGHGTMSRVSSSIYIKHRPIHSMCTHHSYTANKDRRIPPAVREINQLPTGTEKYSPKLPTNNSDKVYIYIHGVKLPKYFYCSGSHTPTHKAEQAKDESMFKIYMHTHTQQVKKNLIILTVKHCIFSGRLVSGAAPWFDSTASEM